MKFIRNILIGIALYEAVRYLFKEDKIEFTDVVPQADPEPPKQIRDGEVDVIKGARQTEHLSPEPLAAIRKVSDDLDIGNDPQANLTGPGPEEDKNDPWKNSLADDELRAPDS